MGFSVNTNINALSTYQNLQNTQNSLSSSLAKLSSGLRINNAGDDAAGLTIATSLGSQVSGLQQASRNAQDGVSVVQTADGALSQAQSLLGRLRDLAVQAGNDSNSESARTAISTEGKSITDELTRLGNSVNFNGKNLLDGKAGSLAFQVGADGNSNNQISVDLSSADLTKVASTLASGTTYQGFDPAATKAADSVAFTSSAGATVSTTALKGVTGVPAQVTALNADSGFSAKFTAVASSDSSKVNIIAKDGGTVSAVPTTGTTAGSALTVTSDTTGKLAFDTAAHAQASITAIDAQIANVSTVRSNIGALENRFASAISTISTSVTNLTAAKSRITDVDMASEMVNYSRANILSQTGTAMLAQANSLPQGVLKLLG